MCQKGFRLPFEQHRNRRERAGENGERRDDGGRLPVRDRVSGPGVEQMTIPASADLEVALVIAARGHRARTHFDGADDGVVPTRMANADAPRGAVGVRADDANVPAQVDESVRDAVIGTDRRSTVDGVLLAHAAEIEFHATLRQLHVRVVPPDALPADQLARHRKLALGGDERRAAAEIPRTAQHARRQVEAAPAQLMTAVGVSQQCRRLAVDRDRRRAGCAVDGARHTVIPIAAELRFDAQHVGNRDLRDAIGPRAPVGPQFQLVVRGHRAKRIAKRRTFSAGHRCSRRQKRFSKPTSIHRAENSASPGLPLPPACQPERWR